MVFYNKLFCANWKMNKTIEESITYINKLVNILSEENFFKRTIILFPNFCILNNLYILLKSYSHNIKLGGQNFYPAKNGAYTGETSIEILKSAGAEYFLIGHSERRYILGESQDFINRKVLFAAQNNVKIIYCFGERLEDRNNNRTENVIREQLDIFNNIDSMDNLYFAYEPVWAIGTGVRAKKEDIIEMITMVKDISNNRITKLMYGGSIDEKNIGELSDIKDLGGYLVGSASLDPRKFAEIIKKGDID